jgi:HSP20 family molecular chaperone IbpA
VDEAEAKAKYRRGVLSITLPKRESATVRRIEVQS